jgi:hypothetical protein
MAESFPQDPDLFSDPIHMGEPGFRLQAWIALQQLVPWMEERLRDRRLPRPMGRPLTAHPSIDAAPLQLVPLRTFKETCH